MGEFPKYLFTQRIAKRCGVTRQYAHGVIAQFKEGRLLVRTRKQRQIVAAYLRLKKEFKGHAA